MLAPLCLVALVATAVLAIAYAAGRRWLSAALTLGLLGLLSFGLFSVPMPGSRGATIKEYGAVIIFFGPLFASLASREVFRRLRATVADA